MNKFGIAAASVIGLASVGMLAGFARPTAPAPAAAQAKAFSVDKVHSSIVFHIKHMGVAKFFGRFNDMSGSYTLDPANPGSGNISVTIDANSIDTANSKRDDHLRSPDFFNVKQFPEITFTSKSITGSGENMELVGDMTLLGVTKEVRAKLMHTGEGTNPRGGTISGIYAEFTFKRSDYGMTYMLANNGLGDEVTVMVALEGRAN